MKVTYPDYYAAFRCIASACPDSCCHEWEVDVDEEAAAFYRSLPGELGDRLRQVLKDTPEGICMTIENRRCPMWRQDGLCQIQAELGHEALCHTCREFPRIRHDYGTFAEWGLELSCPEAARLILNWNGTMLEDTQPGNSQPDYNAEDMTFLLESRKEFLAYLDSTTDSPRQILTTLLTRGIALQSQWDGDELTATPIPATTASLFRFFTQLEILTDRWRTLLAAPPAALRLPNEIKPLLRYFIGRHWLQAISDFDLLGRICFCVAACILIGSVDAPTEQAAQLFSKEIENDPENLYRILDGTYTEISLSPEGLLGILA